MSKKRFLILSDGKPGHVNQSIAFAKHLGCDYDLTSVSFNSRFLKAISYLADHLGFYSKKLFRAEIPDNKYAAVISTGSETYYANKTMAKQLGARTIAIMLPKGYRYDFDLIVAQQHDKPPDRDNIFSLPINLTYAEPQGILHPEPNKCYVSLIIGGDSSHEKLDVDLLRRQINEVFKLFPQHAVWMTTSRRTPDHIEEMLHEFQFDQAVYFSRNPVNPIPDFLEHSEYVFLTADSSSMISEAVSCGRSCVEVLPLSGSFPGRVKIQTMIAMLEKQSCLHLFNGAISNCCEKILLSEILTQSLREKL